MPVAAAGARRVHPITGHSRDLRLAADPKLGFTIRDPYSTFRPSFLISASHFPSSRSMLAAYSSGELAIGSPPSATMRLLTSSDITIRRSSLFSRSMMSRGVPANAALEHGYGAGEEQYRNRITLRGARRGRRAARSY